MTQALPKLITFNEFIEWYPNDGKYYELYKRIIVEIPPSTGAHEKVIAFLSRKLTVEFDRLKFTLWNPQNCISQNSFCRIRLFA